MTGLISLIGKNVELEISAKTLFQGTVIDVGLDIIILFDSKKYLYIPLLHLQGIKEKAAENTSYSSEEESPLQQEGEVTSYRKILSNAKGQFVEIFVTGNKSIHGYVTSVLNDYIVFYSPVYKSLFISMQHLKWLTPYSNQLTPYSLSREALPVVPYSSPLNRSFEEQMKKFIGQLIILDMGEQPEKIGLLKNVSNNIVELVTSNSTTIYWKVNHLKTFHFPNQ
ncbi:DUF2642 domain-containing protein [Sutcliffiella rhizosphaerae]|uniref:DUF2642 domain-containing protein n=1 Tax=Sutcliffiella rhizosphaerae TaxID=2880967 RepID=A0ABM8YUS4_9BACI|nr:DUF2642 domain-containing protein [Sutcliffiella rhizosphaerae]CAG9623708.1 hypothetical protein BACCIP111883_04540 [Sutcliffiella rhizosphaerae]